MRITLLALAMVLVLSGSACAQSYGTYYPSEFLWGLTWNLGLPTGDTKDYTDYFSLRGIGLEGRKYIKPDLTIGLSFQWQVFWEKVFGTTDQNGFTVTGNQWRYLNFFPLLVNAYKYWNDYGDFRPYVGLNTGAYIIENRFEIGGRRIQETNWHFGLAPAVGAQMPAGRLLGFFEVRYNYAFKSGDTPDQSYFNFIIGVGLQ
jgi:hypothetical protein